MKQSIHRFFINIILRLKYSLTFWNGRNNWSSSLALALELGVAAAVAQPHLRVCCSWSRPNETCTCTCSRWECWSTSRRWGTGSRSKSCGLRKMRPNLVGSCSGRCSRAECPCRPWAWCTCPSWGMATRGTDCSVDCWYLTDSERPGGCWVVL